MLYTIAHFFRDKMGWLWNMVETINSQLFSIRYGKKLDELSLVKKPEGYEVIPIKDVPTEKLVMFFRNQPKETFMYFNPHAFDTKTIMSLQRNRSFLAYVLLDNVNRQIAGYFFNKCFFHGQGFRGRMVDINYRGKGLGTAMNKMLNEVGFGIGLRLFETVSKNNVASYRSALSASKVRVVEEMQDNVLYLEILPS